MLRTILVPQDGSVLAERALPYATRLARGAGARVVLVRATTATPLPGMELAVTERAAVARAEAELGVIADRVHGDGLTVDSHAFYGAADMAILDAARQADADLIVMSTHGRSGLSRWVYGSIADAVLRAAAVPVLLVPAACRKAWASTDPLRVLAPLDGSTLAERALDPIADIADALGAELVLMQVVEFPVPMLTDGAVYQPPSDQEADLAAARQYLDDVAARLRAAGRSVATWAIAGPPSMVGQAAMVIAEFAQQEGVDAIAMATHGRGSLARLVLGSVATGVLQRATVPVLLVRPGAAERRAAGLSAAEVAGMALAP